MQSYSLKINNIAIQDIEEASFWYNLQRYGLGDKFKNQVIEQIEILKQNPQSFSYRYKNVRCFKIVKFPFLIHFTVENKKKLVSVFGVLHTSRNPKIAIKIL